MAGWLRLWVNRSIISRRVYYVIWALSLVVTLSGSIAVGMSPGTRLAGYAFLAVGGSALALLALFVEIRMALRDDTGGWLSFVVVAAGGMAFVSGVAFTTNVVPLTAPVPLAIRLVVLATAFQALLLTVDLREVRRTLRERVVMLLASHGAIFTGSIFTLSFGPTVPRTGLLLYASGFAALLLNAFWARTSQTGGPESGTDRRRWEGLLLSTVVVGMLSTIIIVLTTQTGTLTLSTSTARFFVTLTGTATIVAFAMLSAPQSAPSVLRWLDSPIVSVAQHVLTLFIIVNGFVLGIFVAVPWLFLPVFGFFIAILVIGVTLNYAMLIHAWRRGHDTPPADPTAVLSNAGITVVITAVNEADALSESLRENVTTLAPFPFLLIPAARSTDGTQELMHAVRDDHPDRVRVVEATGGSKAADLNAAWDLVETPYVIVLDADETVTPAFVARALQVLSARPDVGIVQGRKYATYPDVSRLSRFASAERQHSTWLDHPFDADVLAAAHFAGSAAVLRREVLPAVDGFASDVLTEDIDLTTRLYLETNWDVAYVSDMVARELLPGTWMSLLRQRERWSRGWAQVAYRRIGAVLCSSRRLGLRRTIGLSWLLFLAVSAPLYTIFPALVLPTVALNTSLNIPPLVAIALAIFLLPEHAISFVYAVFRDPEIPKSMTPRRVLTTVAIAYLWIVFGWIIQLHSMYLQFAAAPQTWTVTQKMRPVVMSDTADD